MTDETSVADAAPTSLREDLEAAWDSLAAEAEDEAPGPDPADEPPEDAGEAAEFGDDEADAHDIAEDAYLPPEHWPAEWRDRFEALPDDAKPYALDLHGQFEKAHSERSQAVAEREKELDGLAEVDAALAPWREDMRAQGISDGAAISTLLEAHALMEQDPEAALGMIAESYGVAPPALPAAAPAGGPGERHDELLDSLERYAAEQHELRMLAAMEAELDARARAADADGRPRFPHFDAVRPKLAALVRTGAAENFEDAYEQALWADPATRQKALEARDAELAARRDSARKAEVAKARNAGRAALSGSEPARSALPPARSHREELERVWDQMVGA